eukprot:scpid76015/ scgid32325/ UPF0602 protein C4orf47 homolog
MPKPEKERLDQDRMGVFREMSYVTVGDRYGKKKPFKPAPKEKRFDVPFTKSKTGTQDGYFSKNYDRIMEKEAYHDPVAAKRQSRNKEVKKSLAGPYVPPGPAKAGEGQGSYFGTLGGKVTHFSAEVRPRKGHTEQKRNFFVPPPKKGTGFGYSNVLIGTIPPHKSDPLELKEKMRIKEAQAHRDKMKARGAPPFRTSCAPVSLFDPSPMSGEKPGPVYRPEPKSTKKATVFLPSAPAKLPGGCKAGMFTKFPEHQKEPYKRPPVLRDLSSKIRPKDCPEVFAYVPGIRTTRTNSVLKQNVQRRIHGQNFEYAPQVMKESEPPKEALGLPTVEV